MLMLMLVLIVLELSVNANDRLNDLFIVSSITVTLETM